LAQRTKRLFEIAKELGVSARVIIEKCRDEGITRPVVRDQMTPVPAWLEASIRVWFRDGEDEGGVLVKAC
jgi:hypothetical protein